MPRELMTVEFFWKVHKWRESGMTFIEIAKSCQFNKDCISEFYGKNKVVLEDDFKALPVEQKIRELRAKKVALHMISAWVHLPVRKIEELLGIKQGAPQTVAKRQFFVRHKEPKQEKKTFTAFDYAPWMQYSRGTVSAAKHLHDEGKKIELDCGKIRVDGRLLRGVGELIQMAVAEKWKKPE